MIFSLIDVMTFQTHKPRNGLSEQMDNLIILKQTYLRFFPTSTKVSMLTNLYLPMILEFGDFLTSIVSIYPNETRTKFTSLFIT